MHVSSFLKSAQKCCTVEAGGGSSGHAVRGVCANPCRCGGGGVCAVAACAWCGAGTLGARPAVCQRGRGAIFAGGGATFCDGAAVAPGRGSGSDGGRFAQWWPDGGGGRSLGRANAVGFYRDTAIGAAGRGAGRGLLVDPAGGVARFKCRAQSVAGGILAIGAAPGRSAGTGRSALAGGIVPLALCRPRYMGGAL